VTCALHPHAGTAVERREDLHRVLDGCGIDLCLDTGHLLLGGVQPLDIAHDVPKRIAHVHLKDADAALAERWRAGGFSSMREAVDAGIWRGLGTGDAEVAACMRMLSTVDYDGWYVVEFDASLAADDVPSAEQRVDAAARDRAWAEACAGAGAVR
jgi:inosose dehydratase